MNEQPHADKPVLACVTPMKKVSGAKVVTIEGFPENVRRTLGRVGLGAHAVRVVGFGHEGDGRLDPHHRVLGRQGGDPVRGQVGHDGVVAVQGAHHGGQGRRTVQLQQGGQVGQGVALAGWRQYAGQATG